MDISEPKSITVPEIALIAATRGAIGFGAGLLLAGKFKRERRKVLGYEEAKAIQVAMDIYPVRKLGVPGHEELAMGATSTGRVRVLNDDLVSYLRIPRAVIGAVAAGEPKELERRQRGSRGERPEP